MNILLDASVLELLPTGVAKVTLGLYEACRTISQDLQAVAAHRRRLTCSLPESMGRLQKGAYYPAQLWRNFVLPSLARRQKPDIIHFPWNGKIPRLGRGPRVVSTLHDVLPLSIPDYFATSKEELQYRRSVQRDLDRSHLVFTDSYYSKKQILSNFTVANEPVVLYYGPTLQPARKAVKAAANATPYFLYVGGYDPRKGLIQLLDAFLALHREQRLQSRLILAGSKRYFSRGFAVRIQQGLALGVLEEQGYVSDAELAVLVEGAIALVYPSKYEGFGLPPLEAMSLGCPVITTQETSLPEICGDAVYYADPQDLPALAEGLVRLEEDADLRRALSNKGLIQARKFSWHQSAHTFLGSLRGLCEQTQ